MKKIISVFLLLIVLLLPLSIGQEDSGDIERRNERDDISSIRDRIANRETREVNERLGKVPETLDKLKRINILKISKAHFSKHFP